MKYLLTLLWALTLTACASESAKPLQNVNFMDLEVFDNNLERSMDAGTEDITVKVMGDLTINRIPERLGKWLSVVSENGQLDYEPKTKSLEALAFLPALYDFVKEKLKYHSATEYDATVFYQQGTGKIDQIVFRKKHK
jgi:hypothetical protein